MDRTAHEPASLAAPPALVGGGMTVLFRYGPSREKAKWRWLSVGAALATLVGRSFLGLLVLPAKFRRLT